MTSAACRSSIATTRAASLGCWAVRESWRCGCTPRATSTPAIRDGSRADCGAKATAENDGDAYLPAEPATAPLLEPPAGAADLLKREASCQVQMVDGEIAGLVARLESPELEPKDERTRRAPLHVPLAHEITEPAVGQDVGVLRIVDATAAAEHPRGPRPQIQLPPSALGAHRRAGHAGILADRAAAEPRDRLADERLAQQLRGAELEPGIECDGAGLEQRVAGQRIEPAQPTCPPIATSLGSSVGPQPSRTRPSR